MAVPEAPGACGFDRVAEALRARLPNTPVVQGQATSDADVQVSLLAGAEWSLEVRAPGEQPLRRDLPAPGEDCVALSEAAALMTSRYLESVQWTGAAPEVSRLPPPPPVLHWRPAVQLAGGAGLGLTGFTPVGELDLEFRRGTWVLGVGGAYLGGGQLAFCAEAASPCPPQDSQGTLLRQSAAFQGFAGGRWDVGNGALRLDLAGGSELLWAWTQGQSVLQRLPAVAPLPFVGLRLGYEWSLGAHWNVFLRAQARLHLGQSTFILTGYIPSQVKTLQADGDLALGLGYAFF